MLSYSEAGGASSSQPAAAARSGTGKSSRSGDRGGRGDVDSLDDEGSGDAGSEERPFDTDSQGKSSSISGSSSSGSFWGGEGFEGAGGGGGGGGGFSGPDFPYAAPTAVGGMVDGIGGSGSGSGDSSFAADPITDLSTAGLLEVAHPFSLSPTSGPEAVDEVDGAWRGLAIFEGPMSGGGGLGGGSNVGFSGGFTGGFTGGFMGGFTGGSGFTGVRPYQVLGEGDRSDAMNGFGSGSFEDDDAVFAVGGRGRPQHQY